MTRSKRRRGDVELIQMRQAQAQEEALAAEVVERAAEPPTYSQQPRFTEGSVGSGAFWRNLAAWVDEADLQAPALTVSNLRERGEWLRQFWPREPFLSGVLNSVVAIDKNRGWTLVGGRNTVAIYANLLHYADQRGWRAYCQKTALAYYTNDFGAVTELGRADRDGQLRGIYCVDPVRCKPTGRPDLPLSYIPPSGQAQAWRPLDFFRLVSLESTDETMRGIGLCAVSRALELAKIMVAIYRYSQERLLARMPNGLLLLSGIDEYQWRTAMEAREEQMTARERRYYGAVDVLANASASADAKLVALSQLPDGFDLRTYTDLLMYGYALVFGYDPREFWPVSSGALGTATETERQHVKATGKGAADFTLQLQEALNQPWVLPPTAHFEFEERDDAGRLQAAQVAESEARVVEQLYQSGLAEGAPLVTREEARQLLAEAGLIPSEWTAQEEQVKADDEQNERLLSTPKVQRMLRKFPGEPLEAYTWTPYGQRWRTIYVPRVVVRGWKARQGLTDDETRFQIAIAGVLGEFMDDAEAAIRRGETPDTNELSTALLLALLPLLTAAALKALQAQADDFGLAVDQAELAQLAGTWAREYAYTLVGGITDTTTDLLRQAIAQYQTTPGMTAEALRALLEPAFGARRADLIAITENTRALAAGARLYAQLLRERYGLEILERWQTAEDERVCPICGALDGKGRTVWEEQFPGGPPAHPRCRCTIRLEVMKR